VLKRTSGYFVSKSWGQPDEAMAIKKDKYAYRVTWSEEDNEYVGLCSEFPSLSWLADTPEKALKGIRKLVGNVLSGMIKDNEPIHDPIACRHFSGKFMVWVPPDIHRKLAILAAESCESLNRITSSKLNQ
jgi:predicted HicB family RNase H-like nuclease